MKRGALAAFVLILCVAHRTAVAQTCIPVSSPAVVQLQLPPDPFPVAPRLFEHVVNVDSAREPVTVHVDIGLNSDFGLLAFTDSVRGDTASMFVRRLLPQNSTLYFRASVVDRFGCNIGTTYFPDTRHTGPYLTLLQPNSPIGQTLSDTTPTFVWRSARVDVPPGPWVYDLTVTDVATGLPIFFRPDLRDTMFTIPATQALHFQTSYRWSVKARLSVGNAIDTVRVWSAATFTITQFGTLPTVTLLYQNFPNPFPTPTSSSTCIWFDLSQAATVKLTVYTLFGDRVRTLVPGLLPSQLPANRYGRGNANTGCDPVNPIQWDGRADDGRYVPPGIYLLRFEASGVDQIKKIVYRGR